MIKRAQTNLPEKSPVYIYTQKEVWEVCALLKKGSFPSLASSPVRNGGIPALDPRKHLTPLYSTPYRTGKSAMRRAHEKTQKENKKITQTSYVGVFKK